MDECRGEKSFDFQCEKLLRQFGEEYDEEDGSGDQSVIQRQKNTKKPKLRPENGPLTISQLFYEYPACPPIAFYNVKEFFSNENLNDILTNDKYVERDIRNWRAKLNWWKLSHYNSYYNDPVVQPYFNAYNRTTGEVYYDVATSVDIANKLLLYQYNNDTEKIFDFLTDLLNVIEMRIPKLNALAIHGEPNAGKNYFFDAVAAFFINYGCLGTANKTNNFAFAEVAGKRIVLWNQPNYESYHVGQLKELLGGETTCIPVISIKDMSQYEDNQL